MKSPEAQFMTLVSKFSSSNPKVFLGKMMSAPGLKYGNKVFAFYNKQEMGFRMGPDFDPVKFGLNKAKPLSPFKTKPPLKGWFIIDADDSNHWEVLAGMALNFTMTLA